MTGAEATPLYRDLARLTGVAPGWNFHKYLIARDGRVVAQFPSKVRPDDPELRAAEKHYARGNLVTLQGRSLILLQQSLQKPALPTAK